MFFGGCMIPSPKVLGGVGTIAGKVPTARARRRPTLAGGDVYFSWNLENVLAKEKIPDVVITSDVIVGFPTETDEEFEDTISLINEVGFGGLFTFIYSIRKGTPAEKMVQVPDEDKKRRFERLVQYQTEKSFEFNSKYLNKTVRVLCDGKSENKENTYTGRTEGGIIVNFCGENILPGEFYDIEITKTLNWALFGNIVNK